MDRGDPGDAEVLARLGIDPDDTGPLEDLLAARRARLLAAERAFVESELDLGLTWAAGS